MGFIGFPVGAVGSTPQLGGPGLALIRSVTFSAAATVSVDGCFTRVFDDYVIRWSFTGSTTIQAVGLRLRVLGSDASGADYNTQTVNINGTGVVASRSASATQVTPIGFALSTALMTGTVEVFGPSASALTTFLLRTVREPGTVVQMQDGNASHGLATGYDGFTIIPAAGTITGTVSVFGYRKA